MASPFEFDPEKALAVVAYLARETGETMYPILKMVYVADRTHLERYGRPITGDEFIAMKQGACPSKIYDTMKVLRGEPNHNYLPRSEQFLAVDPETHDIELLAMPSLDVLSESERECLDETLSILKRYGSRCIREMAHDPAWKGTTENSRMGFTAIAKSLRDGEALAEYLESRFD